MANLGTLLASKDLLSKRRTVTGAGPHVLTPGDIGSIIYVDHTGASSVTMPRISGDTTTSVHGIGAGGSICIIAVTSNDVTVNTPAGTPDTFNAGQAFPLPLLTNDGDWVILTSDGSAARPGDWAMLFGPPAP